MKKQLMTWMLRPLWPVNGVMLAVGTIWILFTRQPLMERLFLPSLFTFVHSLLVVRALGLGASQTAPFRFLYTRGYSRDELWTAAMLAGLISVALVWLPCAVAVLTPLRSWVQAGLFQNPFYPLMQPREWIVPAWCLVLYMLFVSTLHYAWIRSAQPTAEGPAGRWLVGATVATVVCWMNVPSQSIRQSEVFFIGVALIVAALSLVLTFTGRRLHQSIEIR